MTLLAMVRLGIAVSGVALPANLPLLHLAVTEAAQMCPRADRDAEGPIRNVLGSPLIAEMRQNVDLGTASLADIQLLRAPEDREACARLWDALEAEGTVIEPADGITFYRSGDRYFVSIDRRRPTPPGIVRLGFSGSVHVYDAEYRLIDRFAS